MLIIMEASVARNIISQFQNLNSIITMIINMKIFVQNLLRDKNLTTFCWLGWGILLSGTKSKGKLSFLVARKAPIV